MRLFVLCGRSIPGTIVQGDVEYYWLPNGDFRAEGVRQVDLTSAVERIEWVRGPLGRSTVSLSLAGGGRRWLSTRPENLERILSGCARKT